MRTEESTTTAGIRDVVGQIFQGVRQGHTALAEQFFKRGEAQPGETGGAGDGKLALTIERDGEFQMKLRLGFRTLCLQARGEVIRYVEGQAHGRHFNLRPGNGNGAFGCRFPKNASPAGCKPAPRWETRGLGGPRSTTRFACIGKVSCA